MFSIFIKDKIHTYIAYDFNWFHIFMEIHEPLTLLITSLGDQIRVVTNSTITTIFMKEREIKSLKIQIWSSCDRII